MQVSFISEFFSLNRTTTQLNINIIPKQILMLFVVGYRIIMISSLLA